MEDKQYPVVLRFEGMKPEDIGGYEAHRHRRGGDLGHVNRNRPKPRRLIGSETWAEEALAEIELMKLEAFAAELADLDRRNRRKDLERRRIEGPRDPWRASRHGPMRELVLTANREWFEQTESSDILFDTVNEEKFERRAIAWLRHAFGDDVIHARADLDEQAYHIHAVIMPRATVKKYGTVCRVLQPSIHPLIRDYEAAQDDVGAWFSRIGLVRGRRHKQAIRDALNDGREPPVSPRHVRPAQWHAQEERRLARKAAELELRERRIAEREDEAEAVLSFAEAVASGQINENGQPQDTGTTGSPAMAPGRLRMASSGFALARKAFRAAMKRLAEKAVADAEREAARTIAAAVEEIKAADNVIVQIAYLLPLSQRERIARVRQTLTARIMVLDPRSKGRPDRSRSEPRTPR